MLLPISHEKMRVRRLPVVTLVLIAFTIAIHAVTSFVQPSIERRVVAAITDAEMIRREQPSLGTCPALERVAPGAAGELDAALAGLARLGERETDEVQAERRARYDAACAAVDDAVRALPAQRFGFVPARGNWYALVTATFLHADWWHVIGNMWFLFLCALALEDRWGRAAFPLYYVVAGVVATFAHYVTHASSPTPVVGASGAVAGAMGAFLVLFATTKIRFVGVLGFRLLWFRAPAYVMLPLWALVEIAFGLIGGGATAHWAHVGGFVFGAAVAGVFRLVGIDRRLDDAVERAAVLGDDPRVDAARELVKQGRAADAVALLSGLAKEKPESVHVQEALREATAAAPPPPAPSPSGARLSTLRAAAAAPRSSAPIAVAVAPLAPLAPLAPVAPAAPAADPTAAAPYFPAPQPRK